MLCPTKKNLQIKQRNKQTNEQTNTGSFADPLHSFLLYTSQLFIDERLSIIFCPTKKKRARSPYHTEKKAQHLIPPESMSLSQPKTILNPQEKVEVIQCLYQYAKVPERHLSPVLYVTTSRNNDVAIFCYDHENDDFVCRTVPDYEYNGNHACLTTKNASTPFWIPYTEPPRPYILEISKMYIEKKPREDIYKVRVHGLNTAVFWLQFDVDEEGNVNKRTRSPVLLAKRNLFDRESPSGSYVRLYHVNIHLSPSHQAKQDIYSVHLHALDDDNPIREDDPQGTGRRTRPARLCCRLSKEQLTLDINRVIETMLKGSSSSH